MHVYRSPDVLQQHQEARYQEERKSKGEKEGDPDVPLRTCGGLIDCITGVGHAHADTQIYGVARGKYIALRYIFICIYVQALAVRLFREKEKEEGRHRQISFNNTARRSS